MAIEYVEIRSKTDREVIGIIDGAKSIIWTSKYYGVGDFEIYASKTNKHISLLQEGNYVTRPNDYEDGKYKVIGIIEHFETTRDEQYGEMIVASGRFAKSILDRRQIYQLSGTQNTATILRGNVETNIRSLVSNNAINCSFDSKRNISILSLGVLANIPAIIVDENGNAAQKQVSYENLLEYSDSVLEEYEMSAYVLLDDDTKGLKYTIFIGADRSTDNVAGNEPVIFSAEFDNLTSSEYVYDVKQKKTTALIGGAGEDIDRFYTVLYGTVEGIDRRETWVDASSINKKYKDENEQEQEYTDTEYREMLETKGKQELSKLIATETFDGVLNVTGGIWRLNEDYSLGDIVTIQDNKLGKYINVRILEIIEAQDENGYSVSVTYKN